MTPPGADPAAGLTSRPLDKTPPASAVQLLDATAALLSERPALDVTLSEIAQRSGVNSAMIKYHFGNKEGLLLALIERDVRAAMTELAHLSSMNIPADQKLKIHISGVINANFRSPYLNRLVHYLVEGASTESSRHITEIVVRPMLDAYRTIIRQGIEEGRFKDDVDPALLYYSLVGACDHLFHASSGSLPLSIGQPRVTEELRQRYIAHITSIFLRGLAPD